MVLETIDLPDDEVAPKLKAEKKPATPRGTAAERDLKQLGDELEEQLNTIFGFVALALPVTGTYGIVHSEAAIRSLLDIAKRRPKVLNALRKVADGIDGAAIGRYALGLGVALQVDRGALDPNNIIAGVLGVSDVYQTLQESEQPPPTVMTQAPHVRFSPIS